MQKSLSLKLFIKCFESEKIAVFLKKGQNNLKTIIDIIEISTIKFSMSEISGPEFFKYLSKK